MKRNCKNCTKDISDTDYRNKFCSSSCYMKYRGTKERGKDNPNWRGGKIAVKCDFCKNEFLIDPAIKKLRRHCSIECRSETYKKERAEEKSFNWKGDKVGYSGVHGWIRRKLGRAKKCILCGREDHVQWANISQEYKRRINDFVELCVKCHSHYDHGFIKRDYLEKFLSL